MKLVRMYRELYNADPGLLSAAGVWASVGGMLDMVRQTIDALPIRNAELALDQVRTDFRRLVDDWEGVTSDLIRGDAEPAVAELFRTRLGPAREYMSPSGVVSVRRRGVIWELGTLLNQTAGLDPYAWVSEAGGPWYAWIPEYIAGGWIAMLNRLEESGSKPFVVFAAQLVLPSGTTIGEGALAVEKAVNKIKREASESIDRFVGNVRSLAVGAGLLGAIVLGAIVLRR